MIKRTWNKNKKIQNNSEVKYIAQTEDFLFSYKGFNFLLVRKNDINLVILASDDKTETTPLQAMKKYITILKNKNIDFVSVTTKSERRFFIYQLLFNKLNLSFVTHSQKDLFCIYVKI